MTELHFRFVNTDGAADRLVRVMRAAEHEFRRIDNERREVVARRDITTPIGSSFPSWNVGIHHSEVLLWLERRPKFKTVVRERWRWRRSPMPFTAEDTEVLARFERWLQQELQRNGIERKMW